MIINTENKLFDDLAPEIEKFVNRSVEISDRIEEILKSKNISQREFADMIGKSESEIRKWLCVTHNFTIKSIAKIETVLKEDVLN
ncbi:MAG: helix-turn-helix transcriptional regulator [Ignavibacteria bacterium]|nr:helix-turn-helix transcriptional regulator [Ignavibacteria bacterium]